MNQYQKTTEKKKQAIIQAALRFVFKDQKVLGNEYKIYCRGSRSITSFYLQLFRGQR